MTLMAVAVLLTCASERLSCCSGKRRGSGKAEAKGSIDAWRLAWSTSKIGIDIDGFIASDLGRRRRLAELHRLGGNIITRLRTGDDAPLAFQQLIGMADGHKAHAAADHLLAQRRQPIARQPDAKGDSVWSVAAPTVDTFSLRPSPYDNVPLSYISYKKIIVSCNCYICSGGRVAVIARDGFRISPPRIARFKQTRR